MMAVRKHSVRGSIKVDDLKDENKISVRVGRRGNNVTDTTMYFLTLIHLTLRLKKLLKLMVPTGFAAKSLPIACLIPKSFQIDSAIMLSSPKYFPNAANPPSPSANNNPFAVRRRFSAARSRSDLRNKLLLPATQDDIAR